MEDYKAKYLKYKTKYIELRNMKGGDHQCDADKCRDICVLNITAEKQKSYDEGLKKGSEQCNASVTTKKPHVAIGHINDATKAAPEWMSNIHDVIKQAPSVISTLSDTFKTGSAFVSEVKQSGNTQRGVSPMSKQNRIISQKSKQNKIISKSPQPIQDRSPWR